MNRVVVFQTWGIGDMIMITPMLHAIKEVSPTSYVNVIAGNTGAAAVVRHSDLCSETEIWNFNDLPVWRVIWNFISLRKKKYDIAILATGLSIKFSWALRLLSGIKIILGDCDHSTIFPYTDCIDRLDRRHRVEKNIAIANLYFRGLGVGKLHIESSFEGQRIAIELWRKMGFEGKRVLCLHPGGDSNGSLVKRPPIGLCKELIDSLFSEFVDAEIVVILGPSESELFREFSGIHERLSILRDLPFEALPAIVSMMKVVIAGDSGIGHIAAAMQTPVVTLAGPTLMEQTKPYGGHCRVVQARSALPCSPCYGTINYKNCPYQQKCLSTIAIVDVVRVVHELLQLSE